MRTISIRIVFGIALQAIQIDKGCIAACNISRCLKKAAVSETGIGGQLNTRKGWATAKQGRTGAVGSNPANYGALGYGLGRKGTHQQKARKKG